MTAWGQMKRRGFGWVRHFAGLLHEPAARPQAPVAVAQPATPEMPSVDAVESFRILMVGFGNSVLAVPARWLSDLGARVHWASPLPASLPSLAEARGLTHMMIDLDALGGIAVAYEALRTLRSRHPDLPLIVVSEELQVNDFSTERLPLCDASLRAPVVFSALEFALTEAREVNNPQWQQRLKELAATA